MHPSVAALALFRRAGPGDAVEYLSQWNERWLALHFIGGHKEPGESFRACCVREITEGLHLAEGSQVRVAAEPLAHLDYVAFSHGAVVETAYTIELFAAALLGDGEQVVAADPANRWVSEADIRARRCRDGRAVSDMMFRVLTLAGLTPGEFDVFVSYSHQDDRAGWVAALVEAIRAEHARFTNVPLRIFFDRAAIRTMDDWEHRILSGLRSAKVMLAVLSPSYVASAFCRREWETYLEHELALTLPGDGITPIYTVTVPGFDDGSAADPMLRSLAQRQYLDARPWWTEGMAALRRAEVRRRLEALDEDIDERLRRAARAAASPTHALPSHNPNFVGRHDELRRLREILACHRVGAIAAVQGIGGIGKTALAFEYAHGFAEHYPGGRYVLRAEGATDFRAAVVDQLRSVLGIELDDEEKRSYDRSFPRVWAALRGRGRSLLLLDNLDRPELLTGANRAGVLPVGDAVHVVATTRLEPARLEDRERVQCVLLDALPPEDALRLLQRYRPTVGDDECKAALAIVHRLGGHALAVEVVGVFLWQNPDVSHRDYLARLEAEGVGAVEGAAADERVELSRHPEKFVGRLLEPTLATLTPLELRALAFAAQLPPDAVALPWLQTLLERELPEAVARKPGYADPWKQAARRLHGLRLLVQDPKEPRLARVHRLVRDVVLVRMGADGAAEERSRVTEHALERAKSLCDGWLQRAVRWEIEPVHLYAMVLLGAGETSGVELANRIVSPMQNLGDLGESRSLLRRTLAFAEKAYGAEHPNLATSYGNLAMVERALGNPAEARALLHHAIAIDTKVFGADHPNLADHYRALAWVEMNLGNLAEAQAVILRAIAIDEKAHDAAYFLASLRTHRTPQLAIEEYRADHPALADDYNMLAVVEQELGNLTWARVLYLCAIGIGEKAYGADHPILATSYSNLAVVERNLRNPMEARGLLRRAIGLWEKTYDADHPNLARAFSYLAVVEQDLGNLVEARALLHRAISIGEKVYDADHPNLGKYFFYLARVEQDLWRREGLGRAPRFGYPRGNLPAPIATLARRAFAIFQAGRGDQHANTQMVRKWLAENDPDFTDA
jgi:tetratricopeptide (TPR) repeat protein